LPRSPHDEFLELCAVSTSGQLNDEEQKRLDRHLAVCCSCREAMGQYEAVAGEAVLALGQQDRAELDSSWSQEQAESVLFERIDSEESSVLAEDAYRDSAAEAFGKISPASQAAWQSVWTLGAASLVLLAALGISAYRIGMKRAAHPDSISAAPEAFDRTVLQQQISDAGHEREILRSQIAERDKQIVALRHEVEQQVAEVGRLKQAERQLATDLQHDQASGQRVLQERTELAEQLETAQARSQQLEDRVALLEQKSFQDKQQTSSLETQVKDLTRVLRDREAAIDQQQELLAHDRDIRDLMGARDLYVAEVYDVERTGETKKPYGRVFYTKGKSLIFYAYDLDQQAGVKNASSFQAWGRRGPAREQALNLGVFYVDNAAKKRWVLRFDDPKALAQIDAVFVTVEPNGGSYKPSNKPLLFAYLHIDSNHP